ncbi:hypothetical protein RSOLAG22IIIB_13743 [Rhizoctonia solani]|uniref:Uncharacterized protein n=1 Tax=Rhizoctonia solani TaxID=456999 RepID=A0A0K6FQR9_9AGAM|nr:hypothetical protein RSOLAG22IIIB_13743 [Rhizoctonia solani]
MSSEPPYYPPSFSSDTPEAQFSLPSGPGTGSAFESPFSTQHTSVYPAPVPIPYPQPGLPPPGFMAPPPPALVMPMKTPAPPTPAPFTPTTNTPNKQVESGVFEIKVLASCQNGQLKEFIIRTNDTWPSFYASACQALEVVPTSAVLEVRRPRAGGRKWVTVTDAAGWVTFISEVRDAASSARKNPVIIDIRNKTAIPTTKPTPAKKNRIDDLPSTSDTAPTENTELSFVHFRKIREVTLCEKHTKGSPLPVHCLLKRGGRHHRLTHEQIALWSHKCRDEDGVDEFNPPPGLFSDQAQGSLSTRAASNNLPRANNDVDSDSESSEAEAARHARRDAVLLNPVPPTSCESPDLPEPGEVLQYINEKKVESLLVPYPTVKESLEALDAAKPNHQFPIYTDRMNAAGYEYIDEVGQVSPNTLADETDMYKPVAREIHKFSTAVTEMVRMETVGNKHSGDEEE